MKNSEWYHLDRGEISVQLYVLKANNLYFVQGKSYRNRIFNLLISNDKDSHIFFFFNGEEGSSTNNLSWLSF